MWTRPGLLWVTAQMFGSIMSCGSCKLTLTGDQRRKNPLLLLFHFSQTQSELPKKRVLSLSVFIWVQFPYLCITVDCFLFASHSCLLISRVCPRSDRTLHAPASDETVGGAAAAVGIPCLWSFPCGFSVYGGIFQGIPLLKFVFIKNNKSEPFRELGLPRGKIAESSKVWLVSSAASDTACSKDSPRGM